MQRCFPVLILLLIILLACGLQAQEDTSKPPPANPFGIGGIVAWIVCAKRKRDAIGGWLMYFYWMLYSGIAVSILMVAVNLQNYVPQNFSDSEHYALSMSTAVPELVILAAEVVVATFLLIVRTADMLQLLRLLLAAHIAFDFIALILCANHFPDRVQFLSIGVFSSAIWLAYLFLSKRVKHVFLSNDWDTAVESMYSSPKGLKVVP